VLKDYWNLLRRQGVGGMTQCRHALFNKSSKINHEIMQRNQTYSATTNMANMALQQDKHINKNLHPKRMTKRAPQR
jgi:hypothetical protein